MKKVFILLVMLVLMIPVFSQTDNGVWSKEDSAAYYATPPDITSQPETAGDELITFTKHVYGCLVLNLIGGSIMFGSTFMDPVEYGSDWKAFMGIGASFCFGGLILFIKGIYHVGKAGQLMNQNPSAFNFNVSPTYASLSYTF